MRKWLLLLAAILLEVTATLSLRAALDHSAWFALVVIGYIGAFIRLEQGRSSQPSTQLLGAPARALRLSEGEHDHLFHLTGHQPPTAGGAAGLARAGLMRVLDLLGDTPAQVGQPSC
jgi:hypothetical protein